MKCFLLPYPACLPGFIKSDDHITVLADLLTAVQHSDKLPYSRLAINLINCKLQTAEYDFARWARGHSPLRPPKSASVPDNSKKLRAFPTTLLHTGPLFSIHYVCFVVQHWDVFEPYRGMQRRQQKHRSDAADTHGKLFGKNPAMTVRKMVKNPPRFSRKTPKIIDVSAALFNK